MRDELSAALQLAVADSSIRRVILRGHGASVLRHAAKHRPLRLQFANVHGRSRFRAGSLLVDVCAEGPLGLMLGERGGGRVVT